MNPPESINPSHNETRLRLNQACAVAIPEKTMDTTTEQWFSREFTKAEIEQAKAKIKNRTRSARGKDGISYKDILKMKNEKLTDLFNLCLEENDGKAKDCTNSYRAVGLEPCMLKMMTLLIHERLTDWADANGLIPVTQNGFRAKHRTMNNAFILQTLVDKAKGQRKTIYMAFVDLSNAFPSTEQATMWIKLRAKYGAGGKIFD
ncbi:hypothetical protein BKA70DRAFT_1113012, partial [Coprinopsis sp. MPI-PUGE-AT-0042]